MASARLKKRRQQFGGTACVSAQIQNVNLYPAITISSVPSISANINSQMRDTCLIFDTWELEGNWHGGVSFICTVITKWFSDFSDSSTRHIGLVLQEIA